jgi:hypothetical protein
MIKRFKEWLLGLELNPIVVKELRQSVRSWSVVGVMLLFLIALFITILAMIGMTTVTLNLTRPVGREVLQVVLGILIFTSMIFIPLYVGVRIGVERQAGNVDLLYISTLTPARIIRGKLLSGGYLAFLFFSVCTPFMFFSNLLRGVDLPTICTALVWSFMLVIAAVQVAIFLACLPVTKGFKALLAIGTVILVFPVTIGFTGMLFSMFRSGIGSTMGTWRFWETFLIAGGMLMLALGFLHVLAIMMISPPTSNRALPVRLYLLAAWVVSGVLAGYGFWVHRDADSIDAWRWIFVAGSIGAFVCSVSERDRHSLRVRRAIPRTFVKRALAFVFYSGATGGLLWSVIGATLTVVVSHQMLVWIPVWSAGSVGGSMLGDTKTWGVIIALLLYGLSYALFGLSLHRWFFPHRGTVLAGVFAVSLPAAWVMIPTFVLFFVNNFSTDFLKRKQLGNPINLFSSSADTYWREHLTCALIMAMVALILNFRHLFRGWWDFKPLDSGARSA